MDEKKMKTSHNLGNMVQLIDENEVKALMGEAFASVMVNPTVSWAKFVLTDDRKNGNGQRIPKEEFSNLIRSGIHMPVKMALGEIKPGHDDSRPLGTITHLKEVTTSDGSSAILALAALWEGERPADVEYIKRRFAEKQPVDVSWEIVYLEDSLNEEFGSIDLLGTVLRAATIVGNPAYEGRTPFLAIAAKTANAEEESVPDNLEEENMDKVAELEAKVVELEAALAEQKTALETAVAEKDAEIARLAEESNTKETELASLREFKSQADAEAAKKEKLESIKTKFDEAGLKKDDEYFTDNADRLVALDEETLDFMVQELAASLTEDSKTSSASKKTKVPNLSGGENEEYSDPKSLAKMLREQRGKK